ncbi:PAS domain-containing protein, partial [Roseisolibacter sp. H3M3-2]|uniref:PAS domain-containing protein n=1 Tax=Roseisolibacter sp. H3M3-2 TaxID=3031323 RepID=UPI0023DC2E18
MAVPAQPPDPAPDAALLGGLLDAATELACACDAQGRIVHVNRAWERALGYTRAEAVALDPAAMVAPDHRAAYRAATLRLLAGETVADFAAVLLARGADRVACRGRAEPVLAEGHGGAPRVVGTRAMYRDVTAERRAESERARLVATVEATPDVVAVVAASGRLDYLNRAGRRLLGLPDHEAPPARALQAALPPATRDRLLDEGVPAALRDGAWQGEGEVVDGAGMHVPVSIALTALPGLGAGESTAGAAVLRALRERAWAEQALRAARKSDRSHVVL